MTVEQSSYNIEPLTKLHKRQSFSCGLEVLDRYLQQQAGQETRKCVTATFVLIKRGSVEVSGYYTLSAIAIDAGKLPESITKKLPKYSVLPATLLGRLAVDKRDQKKGLGELLLVDALQRSIRASRDVASMAIIVDAKNDHVLDFYKRYGFIPLVGHPYKIFLPMATAIKSFGTSTAR